MPYSSNNDFINKLINIIESNLSDEKFGVKELANKANISREQLHRKLRSSNNYSASKLIREIRLNKAQTLLLEEKYSVSEIAYNVGFSSPSYFVKCFHEYYGYSPGEYKKHSSEVEMNMDSSVLTNLKQKRLSKKTIVIAISLIIIVFIIIVRLNHQNLYKNEKSIIVLPFKNLTENPNNQYIADGLTEEILNFLFWVGDMKVTSRTTSEYFRNSKLSTHEIAKSTNVNYVLEGSIRRQNSKIRINTQLIDGETDKHIWSEIFDRETNDILGVQNEIAIKVANQLKSVLILDEIQKIENLHTSNKQAYDLFLKGRFLLNKANSIQRTDVDEKAMQTSIKYFEKAISLDSSFTQSYVELANAHCGLSGWGYTPGINGWLIGDSIINIALKINPNLGEAHAVKGAIYFWGGSRNFDASLAEFKEALKLSPNYPPLYQWYAQLLMITGPIEDARKYVDIALDIEPYYWVTHNLSAYIYYFEEKYSESLDACNAAKDLYKNYIFNNWLYFLNYIKLNKGEEAMKELQFILESNPNTKPFATQIPIIYQKEGIKGLIKWIAEAQAKSPVHVQGIGRSPYIIAWWYAMLKDKENCLYWLNQCTQKKTIGYMTSLAVSNPDFDFLRNDPRFIDFLNKIGVGKYHKRTIN